MPGLAPIHNHLMLKLASVIPVHNRKEITLNCLERLHSISISSEEASTNVAEYKIIVIDDGSTDGTEEAIHRYFPGVEVLKGNGHLWWAGAVNRGIQYCLDHGYDFIHIMNDDIEFEDDFLHKLILSSDQNSLIGSVTLLSERRDLIFKAGMIETGKPHPRFRDLYHREKYSDHEKSKLLTVDAASGRSLLVPGAVFQKLGLFDEKRLPHSYSDIEFCLRAKKKGYNILINFESKIYSDSSPDKNLMVQLAEQSRAEFVRSLLNLKFSWHFPSIFFSNILHRNRIVGLIGFLHHSAIIIKWVFIKTALPKDLFLRILGKHTWKTH